VGVITGFNDNNEGIGYFEIDYGMYLRSGQGSVMEDGNEIAGTSFGYGESDVLAVVRIGSQVRYYKGTTLLYTSLVPSYGSLYADCSMYMGGDQILNAALTSVVEGAKYGNQTGNGDGTLPRMFGMATDNIVANQGQGRNINPIRVTGAAQQLIVGQGDAYIKVGSLGNALKPGEGIGRGYITPITAYAESGLLEPKYAVIDMPFAPISGWAKGDSGQVGSQTSGKIIVRSSGWETNGGGANVYVKIKSFAYTPDALLGATITGDVRLQPLEIDVDLGDMQGGILSGAAIQLQRLTAKGYTGMQGAGVLQPLQSVWHLTANNTIKGDVVLDEMYGTSYLIRGGKLSGRVLLQRLLGASGGTEGPGHIGSGTSRDAGGAGALQALLAAGKITARETVNAALLLQPLQASGNVLVYGYQITGNAILRPLYTSTGSRGLATLPALLARGVLLDPTGVFEGWAWNVRTGGATRITNLPFLQLLQVPGGPLLGIANDGNVYQLTGDKDLNQPIPWEFETGLADMDESAMKRVPYVYIDGIVQGTIDITVLTDNPGKTYTYEYEAVDTAHHKPHKRKLGNAIYTRSMAFRLSSDRGTYVEIDSVEPEIKVTPRRV